MTFVDAVKSAFQNALVFSGRSRRPAYWWFFLFAFAGAFVFSVLDMLIFGAGAAVLVRVFQLIVFVPFLAVAWRRLQDTGKPGWWVVPPTAVVILTTVIGGSISRRAMLGIVERPTTMTEADALATGGAPMLLIVLGLLQFVAGVLILWWMSRPSQRGPNAYGPEPRVR